MNIRELLIELGREIGFPEKVIQDAADYSDAVSGQGEDVKKMIYRELSEEEVSVFKLYGALIIDKCRKDPEYRKKFMEQSFKHMGNN